MNLNKLFEIQAKLDKHIVEEKGLEGQNLLDEKILALQVELGELANELPELFKFWSEKKNNYEKALEEYVDGLHFILSIGNDLRININSLVDLTEAKIMPNPIDQFFWTNKRILDLYEVVRDGKISGRSMLYLFIFNAFIGLGWELGFTWGQIEQAYLDKNKINFERQANGY